MIAPSTMPMTGSSEVTVMPPTTNGEPGTALTPHNPQANGITAAGRSTNTLTDDIVNSPVALSHVEKFAQLLANSAFTPKHLIVPNDPGRTVATCFRVAAQAIRWGMDPFSVADKTYVVNGKLAYEGALIAALINTRAGITGKLEYEFSGSGDNRTVIVSAQFKTEAKPRTIDLAVHQVKTSKDMWTKDPDQKLVYCGALKWARRHWPEGVNGVLTNDDLDVIAEQELPPPVDPAVLEEKRKAAAAGMAAALLAGKTAGAGLAGSGGNGSENGGAIDVAPSEPVAPVKPAATKPATVRATTVITATGATSIAKPAPAEKPDPTITPITDATREKIKGLRETMTATIEEYDAQFSRYKANSLRNLTELQGVEFVSWLLVRQPDNGPGIEPLSAEELGPAFVASEVAAATIEQPAAVTVETPILPQATEAQPTVAAAVEQPTVEPPTAELSETAPLNEAKGTITAAQKPELQRLIKASGWPVEGDDGQKAWLAGKGLKTFAEMSELQASKRIAFLSKLVDEMNGVKDDVPFDVHGK